MADKKDNKGDFDLNTAINNLSQPVMFIDGFRQYIKSNNLNIKNKKEFDKILNDYSNSNIGE